MITRRSFFSVLLPAAATPTIRHQPEYALTYLSPCCPQCAMRLREPDEFYTKPTAHFEVECSCGWQGVARFASVT